MPSRPRRRLERGARADRLLRRRATRRASGDRARDLQLTVARVVRLEPVRSLAVASANLTRDIGAAQLSAARWFLDAVIADQRVRDGARRPHARCTGRARGAARRCCSSTASGSAAAPGGGRSTRCRRAARDHLRPPRHRTLESLVPAYTTEAMADDAAVGARRAGARRRARLRVLARRHGRAAAGAAASAAGPLAGARRHAGRRPASRRRRRRGARLLPPPAGHAHGGGRLGVGPVQLRPALPRPSIPTASRRTSSGGSASRSTRTPTARRSSRRRCTTATAGSTASRADARRARRARPGDPGRERAPDGRAAPGLPADASSRTRATSTRPRSPRSTTRSATFLGELRLRA